MQDLQTVSDGLHQDELRAETQGSDTGSVQVFGLYLLGHLVVLGAPTKEVKGHDEVSPVRRQGGQRLLHASVVGLEGRTASPLLGLCLLAARRRIVRVRGA